jgi:hypothetical protein
MKSSLLNANNSRSFFMRLSMALVVVLFILSIAIFGQAQSVENRLDNHEARITRLEDQRKVNSAAAARRRAAARAEAEQLRKDNENRDLAIAGHDKDLHGDGTPANPGVINVAKDADAKATDAGTKAQTALDNSNHASSLGWTAIWIAIVLGIALITIGVLYWIRISRARALAQAANAGVQQNATDINNLRTDVVTEVTRLDARINRVRDASKARDQRLRNRIRGVRNDLGLLDGRVANVEGAVLAHGTDITALRATHATHVNGVFEVTGTNPTSGAAGQVVTIQVTNSGAINSASVNGAVAHMTAGANSINVTIPATATGATVIMLHGARCTRMVPFTIV